MNQLESNNNLQDVALVRCFATISLVVWHTYCTVMWGAFGNEYTGLYLRIIPRLIPDANMPLFTILAGYLFYYLLEEKGKYADFTSFLKNKVNRLLIPFLVLGAGINLLEYGKDLHDMLYGGPNHLWYCIMLFYCYIICWIVEKKIGHWINLILMCLSFGLCFYFSSVWELWYKHIVPFGLDFCAFYYGYFYIGYLIRKYDDIIFKNLLCIISLCVLFYIAASYLGIHLINSIFYALAVFGAAKVVANRGGAMLRFGVRTDCW